MKKNIIELRNVSWIYARADKTSLDNISITIQEGECIALMGETGAGKTSFCRLLNGLIPHSLPGNLTGSVYIDGELTADSTVALLAGKVGMAFEDPQTQLFTASARDEIAFALENMLFPADVIKEKTQWALDNVGLAAYSERAPSTLSGGQKQRLIIGAALAMATKVLVLDDPCSQLDPNGARETLSLIHEIRARTGITVIVASSSGEEVSGFADKICVLKNGRIAAFDTPRNIFANQNLVHDCGLSQPQVCAFAVRMAECGHPLPHFPVTLDEAVKAVLDGYA